MPATLHALGILALAAGAIAGLLGLRRRPPTPARTLVAVVAGLVLLVICLALGTHGCSRGAPFAAPALGALALSAAVLALRPPVPLPAGVAAAVIAALLLTIHYGSVVHLDGFVGDSGFAARQDQGLSRLRVQAARTLGEQPGASPAGWARDLPALAEAPVLGELPGASRAVVSSLWHSFFTGIHAMKEHPVDLWYPGGPHRDGAAALEWRDRPR